MSRLSHFRLHRRYLFHASEVLLRKGLTTTTTSLSLSPSLARACSPLAEEFLSCCGSPPVPRSPTTLRRLWSMTDKSCRLSRSPRPRKGRRRSLRAGSGGAAQHNGAPLHDRSLARAFVHLLPSFRPSVTPTRTLSMCLRVFPRKAISLFH